MKVLRTLVCALVMMAVQLPAAADDVAIVVLKHRTLDQVLPMLKPLVDPGGAVTGMENRVIIRTNARNLDQLKKVLASIDIPERRLTISVRQSRDAVAIRDGIDAGVAMESGQARVYSSRSATDEGVTQQVQTVDGKAAFIAMGQSVPFQTQSIVPTPAGYGVAESTMIRNVSTGFSVMPRVAGDRVTLDIHPRRETLGRSTPASVESQSVASTVTGRLGEWIRLGGASGATPGADRGRVLSSAAASRDEHRSIWVKVDEVP
ncbi:MAG: secretin N-terminal domain-containing protein [Burkholderiales bacterium]